VPAGTSIGASASRRRRLSGARAASAGTAAVQLTRGPASRSAAAWPRSRGRAVLLLDEGGVEFGARAPIGVSASDRLGRLLAEAQVLEHEVGGEAGA
jgi:hypothetical protein